jgi:glycosyltransferase involved in cell wall biosynthesis
MLLPLGYSCANKDFFDYQYAYLLEKKADLVSELEKRGALVHCLHAKGNWDIFFRMPELRQLVRREKIDLIHAHLPMAGVIARLAALPLGVPVVYTEHNLMERYHPVTRFLNRYTFGMQKAAIAVSEDVEASIRKQVPRAQRLRTITNGIDVAAFARQPEAAAKLRGVLGIAPDALVIGFVAVFREQKQLPVWLEVAKRVSSNFPDARFLLVGDGPLRPEVDRLIEQLDLKERVILPGLVQEDIPVWFSVMDIFFMSSRFEGLPLALLEAMAASCAVVATQVGGVPEVVAAGISGTLVDYRDKEAMQKSLEDYLKDRAKREAHAKAAAQRVAQSFSIARMTQELEAVYLEVLEGKT